MESGRVHVRAPYTLSFPGEVGQNLLLPQQQKCTNVPATLLPRHARPSETQLPRFTAGRSQAPSASPVPNFQTPRRKAGVQQKPHCLHKQPRHSESPFSVTGKHPEIQAPRYQPRANLASSLAKDSSFKPATLTVFWRASYLTSWSLRNRHDLEWRGRRHHLSRMYCTGGLKCCHCGATSWLRLSA